MTVDRGSPTSVREIGAPGMRPESELINGRLPTWSKRQPTLICELRFDERSLR